MNGTEKDIPGRNGKICILAGLLAFIIVSSLFFSRAIQESSLIRFGWIIHGITIAVLLFTAILCLKMNFSAGRAFLCVAIPLGCLYMVLMTPFSIPDEHFHYQTSYELSNRLMFRSGEQAELGDSEHFNYTSFPQHQNRAEGYERVLKEILKKPETGTLTAIPAHRSLVYFVMQLPQAVGITIGRIFNANFITFFYLGRLMNLLAYLSCVYLALRAVPFLKPMFFLVGISPMALHQAASYSYDSVTNGLALLSIALFLRAVYRRERMRWREYLQLLIVGTLMAPCKAGYFPILFLAFLIPSSRFSSGRGKLLMVSGVLAAASAAMLLVWIPAMQAGKAVIDWGYECYSLAYILEHPLSAARIFLNSLRSEWFTWVMTGMGAELSGFTLKLPVYLPVCYLILLIFSALGNEQEQQTFGISRTQRAVFLGIGGICILLVMGALFVTYTAVGTDRIVGIQGRYFLPVFPFLLLSLKNGNLYFRKAMDRSFIFFALLLHYNLLNSILTYTLNH